MTVQEAKESIEYLKMQLEEDLEMICFTGDELKALDMAIQALEELEQYRALGTVEELKEAREKQKSRREWYQKGYQDGLNTDKWIPCEERLPEEHDGYYSELIRMGLKNYSYDQCSDDVLVTVELNDGQTVIARSQTFDGEWEYEWRTKEVGYNKVKRVRNGHKVIASQPLPQPYKKEGESNAGT